jgi:hypothetical protein
VSSSNADHQPVATAMAGLAATVHLIACIFGVDVSLSLTRLPARIRFVSFRFLDTQRFDYGTYGNYKTTNATKH